MGLSLSLPLALLLAACGVRPVSPPPTMPAARAASAAVFGAQDAGAASEEVLAPNANLVVQGIPPVPMSLVKLAAKYTEFRGHSFVDWHPTQREMLVLHRASGASTTQLFRVAGPMATPEPLTDGADPVHSASYEPRRGEYLVFQRGSGGNEAYQLYRLDLPSKTVTQLTDPSQRHEMQGWLHKSSQMLVMSVPLDKTANGGTRASISQTLRLVDPRQPKAARTVAVLPGGGWFAGGVSWDDSQVALTRYISAGESQLWLLNLATGKTRQVLPAPGSGARATHFAGDFKRDNSGLYVHSDRDGEFRELMLFQFATGLMTPLTRQIPWDMAAGTVTEDGALYATQANVDGRDELRLFDARSFKELPLPALPPGSIGSARFHRKLPDLAFSVNGAQGPNQIYSLDPVKGTVEQWTKGHAPAGVDVAAFTDPQIVRWKSFDGRTISGLLNLPPERFQGKRPVLVQIHGGPESQAKMGFMGRGNHFINEMGDGHHRTQRARLVRLRQGLSGVGQRLEARRRCEGHRCAARLDCRAPTARCEPRGGERRQLRRLHEPGGGGHVRRPDCRCHRRGGHIELCHLLAEHRELPPRLAPRGVRRRARAGDARIHGADFTAEQRRQDHAAAVRGARQERPARALHRS